MSEVRLSARLIVNSHREKSTGDLAAFTRMKLIGSRVDAKRFARLTRQSDKTVRRIISRLEARQWLGFDGKYIFCRSWSRLGARKRFGLYLTNARKLADKFFAYALKIVTKREGNRAQIRGSAKPKEALPVRYYSTALGISERSYHRKVKSAVKSRFLKVIQNPAVKIGTKAEFFSLRKNLPGVPMFRAGTSTVVPQSSTLIFKI